MGTFGWSYQIEFSFNSNIRAVRKKKQNLTIWLFPLQISLFSISFMITCSMIMSSGLIEAYFFFFKRVTIEAVVWSWFSIDTGDISVIIWTQFLKGCFFDLVKEHQGFATGRTTTQKAFVFQFSFNYSDIAGIFVFMKKRIALDSYFISLLPS